MLLNLQSNYLTNNDCHKTFCHVLSKINGKININTNDNELFKTLYRQLCRPTYIEDIDKLYNTLSYIASENTIKITPSLMYYFSEVPSIITLFQQVKLKQKLDLSLKNDALEPSIKKTKNKI